MARALALLAALLMLAGCTDDAGTTSTTTSTQTSRDLGPPPAVIPWTPMACDPSGATTTAQNAARVRGQQGSAEDIVQRIGDAVGDPVTGPGTLYEDTAIPSWPTRNGFINLQVGSRRGTGGDLSDVDEFLVAFYQGNRTWTPDQAEKVALSLGADARFITASNTASQGEVWQEWQGMRIRNQPMGVPGAAWFNSTTHVQFSLGQFFTFTSERSNVTQADAIATGKGFMRCTLDKGGLTEAKGYALREAVVQGVSVINATVTWTVHVDYSVPKESPCGSWDSRWVFVDAWTGAVKYMAFAPCV